ncbi:MAG: TldD/PmbA family protein [Nitrospiraceae bacterium]|nr:MAG: TldD/PmbA family protein [Nitrospiraceae bacterium]
MNAVGERNTMDMNFNEIIERALKKGCDKAEVYIKNSRGISVEAKGGKVESLEASRGFNIALRVIKKKRTGFSFTTNMENIENLVDEAVQGAEWNSEDAYTGIPESSPAAEVQIFDPLIDEIKDDEIIRDALLLEEKALSYDRRIQKVRKAEADSGISSTLILNSSGINASYRSSYYAAMVSTLAHDGNGDSQMGWEHGVSRRKSDIDLEAIGQGSAKRALELLGSRKMSAVKVPIILSPSVAISFLGILSASLSAEAVQKKRSFLAGKKDKAIISRHINIIDDGTMPWKAGTRPVDDEGVTCKNKTLISGGVLKGYMYNHYSAVKDGVHSTGNALRANPRSMPGIGVANFYLDGPATKSGDDLVRCLSRGVKILSAMGIHTANPVSGDFSVGISGQWIENGEIQYPVKEAVISGNILDMFKRVEEIGTDLTFYGNMGASSLLIGDMDISA